MVDEQKGNLTATFSESRSPIGDLTGRLTGIFMSGQNGDGSDFMSPEEKLLRDIASIGNYRPDQVIALATVAKQNPDIIERLYLTARGLRESRDPRKSSVYEELRGLSGQVLSLEECTDSDPWISKLIPDYKNTERKNHPMHYNIRLTGDRVLVLYLTKENPKD